jgi:hypothetical protein
VDFIDAALIRLADPSSRANVFDEAALEHMAQAAYDAGALAISGPYSAVFDKLTLGLSAAPLSVVEGVIRNQNGVPTFDVQIQVGGMGPLLPSRVDALWQGSIVVRSVPADSHIDSVQPTFAVADIDAEIVEDLGGLPVDPLALEAERRTRLVAQMKDAMAQPDLLTDESFGAWMAEIGVSSVGELIAGRRGTLAPGVLQVRFSGPGPGAPATPRALPIVAAILIRDAGFSVAQLLMESKMLRDQLTEQGVAVPTTGSLPALHPFLVVWVVPLTVFDDTAWPGSGATAEALRTSRRANASVWLGTEGIAIAGVEVA